MTDKQIEYILAIAHFKSISKAADHLGISQPYLSQFLSNIENNIGYKLFDRSAYPIIITPFGNAYIEAAKKIENIENDLNNMLSDISDSNTGRVTVALASHMGFGIIPMALKNFIELYPQYTVNIITSANNDYANLLKTGAADFVLTAKIINDAAIESISTKGAMLLVAAPSDYDLELNDPQTNKYQYPLVDLEKLSKVPYIKVKSDGSILSKIIDTLTYTYINEIDKNTIIECDSFYLCAELIQKGLGASIIPSTCIHPDTSSTNTRYYSIDSHTTPKNIHLYYRKNAYLTKAMKTFAETITNTIHKVL